MTGRDWLPSRSRRVALVAAVAGALVLSTAVGGTAAGTGPGLAVADHGGTGGLEGYSVVQGDRCVPVEPLGDGNESVEAFYDYRNPATEPSSYSYSSFGTTHLQENDTSVVFLYEGSDGLGLVLVHDRLEGGSEGGAVTMEFDGLPAEGEWVVEDDNYTPDDGPEIDDDADATWEHGDTWTRVTWVWTANRTDGGAFTGLDDEFELQVNPAFNGDADYRVFDGEVTDWQVLSGSETDPDRTSLDVTEPLVIRSSPCTAVTDLDVDGSGTYGETATIEATLLNEGDGAETTTVPFVVDGELVDEREVTLAAGEQRTVSTTIELDEAGTTTVSAGEETATVSVSDAEANDRSPGFGVTAVVVAAAALVAASLARRRS